MGNTLRNASLKDWRLTALEVAGVVTETGEGLLIAAS